MVRRMLSEPWVHTAYDVAIAMTVGYATFSYHTGYDQAIGLSMAVAVVFRRRRPLTVMMVVSALALTQHLLAGQLPEPMAGAATAYDAAVLIAMVAVVSHAEQVWKAYVAGGIVLLGLVPAFGGIYPFNGPDRGGDLFAFLACMGISAAVWLTAYVLRTRRLYVGVLEERTATAERERAHLAQLAAAKERAEIARELHDVVAHSLAVMIECFCCYPLVHTYTRALAGTRGRAAWRSEPSARRSIDERFTWSRVETSPQPPRSRRRPCRGPCQAPAECPPRLARGSLPPQPNSATN